MTIHSIARPRPESTGVLTPQRAALSMAVRGCFVFPLWWPIETPDGIRHCACPQGITCSRPAKHPVCRGWQRSATRDRVRICKWFIRWPEMNYGIFLGPSRLIVLDEDDHDGTGAGRETLNRLQDRLGPLPRTWVVATGTGRQFYFDAPPDFDWKTDTLVGNLSEIGLGPGVTVKYGDDFVVGPGSWRAAP